MHKKMDGHRMVKTFKNKLIGMKRVSRPHKRWIDSLRKIMGYGW